MARTRRRRRTGRRTFRRRRKRTRRIAFRRKRRVSKLRRARRSRRRTVAKQVSLLRKVANQEMKTIEYSAFDDQAMMVDRRGAAYNDMLATPGEATIFPQDLKMPDGTKIMSEGYAMNRTWDIGATAFRNDTLTKNITMKLRHLPTARRTGNHCVIKQVKYRHTFLFAPMAGLAARHVASQTYGKTPTTTGDPDTTTGQADVSTSDGIVQDTENQMGENYLRDFSGISSSYTSGPDEYGMATYAVVQPPPITDSAGTNLATGDAYAATGYIGQSYGHQDGALQWHNWTRHSTNPIDSVSNHSPWRMWNSNNNSAPGYGMGPTSQAINVNGIPYPSSVKVRLICVKFTLDPTVCEYPPMNSYVISGNAVDNPTSASCRGQLPAIGPLTPDIYQKTIDAPKSAIKRMTHDQLNRLKLYKAQLDPALVSLPDELTTDIEVTKYTDQAQWIKAVLDKPEGIDYCESLASLSGFYSWYNTTRKVREDDHTPLVRYKIVKDQKFTMRLPGMVGPNILPSDDNAEMMEQSYSHSMKVIDGSLPLPKTGFLAKYEGDDYERPINQNYFWYCVTDSPFPISWRINCKMKFYE